jgi:hypothetical protein
MARDLIDRQVVLEHYKVADPAGTFAYCDSIIEFIESLPSVEQDERWIPCSKKLPEMHDAGILKELGINVISDQCNITVRVDGKAWVLNNAKLCDGKWHANYLHSLDVIGKAYEVTAWMPFPQPYEGGGA